MIMIVVMVIVVGIIHFPVITVHIIFIVSIVVCLPRRPALVARMVIRHVRRQLFLILESRAFVEIVVSLCPILWGEILLEKLGLPSSKTKKRTQTVTRAPKFPLFSSVCAFPPLAETKKIQKSKFYYPPKCT